MKSNIYIISPQNVKDNTSLDDNVDDKIIKSSIVNSQEIDLQTKLGSVYYDELMEQIANSGLSLDNEAFLLDYVQPFLVQQAFYYVIPSVYLKATNQGLNKITNATNATSVELADVNFMRNSVKDLADFYLERIEKELELNKSKYPTYWDSCTDEQNVKPNKNSYFGGIYISKNNDK